jgi:hypothetical protein
MERISQRNECEVVENMVELVGARTDDLIVANDEFTGGVRFSFQSKWGQSDARVFRWVVARDWGPAVERRYAIISREMTVQVELNGDIEAKLIAESARR